MRIACLIDSLELVGGAQRGLVVAAQALKGSEFDLSVIDLRQDADSPNPDRLRKAGAKVVHFPAANMRDMSRFRKLGKFLREEQFDLLHTHLMHSNILGILAGNLAKTPVIGSLHNVRINPRKNHIIRYRLETFLLRYGTKAVMAVGHTTADAHRERLKGKTIYVIPNAVDIPELPGPEERRATREALVGDASRPLIISVGRLTTQKGYTYLLSAFQRIREHFPEAALLIAGEGHLFQELSRQIRGLSLEGHAFLLGRREDVQCLLSSCDIFVSSSLWEGLPAALLEAMAAGLPLIATRVGDMPRVVTQEAGLLIPPRDPDAIAGALLELLQHPQERELMGQAARIYAMRHHSLDGYGKKLQQMYLEVLDQPIPPERRQAKAGHSY